MFQKPYFGGLKGVKQGGNRAQSGKKEKLYLEKVNLVKQLEQNAYFCSSIVEKIYIIKVGERT